MNGPNRPGTTATESSGPIQPPPGAGEAIQVPYPLPRACVWLGAIILGYIGIYLCRKNLSVAVPLLQEHFGVSKAEVGKIASYSTLAYAIGKLVCGPVVDKIGGRSGFMASMGLVALFGGLGAFSPGLFVLGMLYSVNRFAGAAGWGSMVKMTSDWFSEKHRGTAIAWLSISYVVGGVCATVVAGWVAKLSGNNWRAVMGVPSIILFFILAACFFILPRTDSDAAGEPGEKPKPGIDLGLLSSLFASRQFQIVLALSFTYTMLREIFNFWTVDFLYSQPGLGSIGKASYLSALFDGFGALGILAMGRIYDKVTGPARSKIMCAFALASAVALAALPLLPRFGVPAVAAGVGLIGFLIYAPYSLFAGVMAVDVHGKQRAATVTGLIDASGYVAGWLSGTTFGKVVDTWGYKTGFFVLAAMMAFSGLLSLMLKSQQKPNAEKS